MLGSGIQGAMAGALPSAGQPGTGPGAPSGCFLGLMKPGGHWAGLCIHPTGCWTPLSAQGCTGWQHAAHPAYNRPATKSIKLPTTSEQSLGEGVGQESSDLLCVYAGGMQESQNKCLPFACCHTSILTGKQWLLCGAWVGSGLQFWQQEGSRAQLSLPGLESMEVSAGNCTSSSLIRHHS